MKEKAPDLMGETDDEAQRSPKTRNVLIGCCSKYWTNGPVVTIMQGFELLSLDLVTI